MRQNLSPDVTRDLLRNTEAELDEQLRQWAGLTAEYYRQKTNEVKEILLLMVAAAERVSSRDQTYATQLTEISTHLQQISDLDDLTSIKRSLSHTSSDLNRCLAKMEQEGRETVSQLREQIRNYQIRVIEVERLASNDGLTGLANRREVEHQLEVRVSRGKPFCVVIIDLNGFKRINDTYGHVAGDAVLKEFASELRRFFRPLDTVGRWGGDEFVVVLDSDLASAKARLSGLEKWLYGDYSIQTATGTQKVAVSAVAGVVDWKPGEAPTQVLARADADMYEKKKAAAR